MCSERPLTIDEFGAAAFQTPETDAPDIVNVEIEFVIGAYQNLLEYSEVVSFTHLSVQEYFDGLWQKFEADNLVAKFCLPPLNHPEYWSQKFEFDEDTTPIRNCIG